MRGLRGWINDLWRIRVQLAESVDQWDCFGCAVHPWFTHGMVPHQCGNIGVQKQRTDRGDTGFQRELSAVAKIEHSFFWICRWLICLCECPATIKNRLPKILRDINRSEICRAQSRHKQNKLEVRHFRMLDIKGLHILPLLMEVQA